MNEPAKRSTERLVYSKTNKTSTLHYAAEYKQWTICADAKKGEAKGSICFPVAAPVAPELIPSLFAIEKDALGNYSADTKSRYYISPCQGYSYSLARLSCVRSFAPSDSFFD